MVVTVYVIFLLHLISRFIHRFFTLEFIALPWTQQKSAGNAIGYYANKWWIDFLHQDSCQHGVVCVGVSCFYFWLATAQCKRLMKKCTWMFCVYNSGYIQTKAVGHSLNRFGYSCHFFQNKPQCYTIHFGVVCFSVYNGSFTVAQLGCLSSSKVLSLIHKGHAYWYICIAWISGDV